MRPTVPSSRGARRRLVWLAAAGALVLLLLLAWRLSGPSAPDAPTPAPILSDGDQAPAPARPAGPPWPHGAANARFTLVNNQQLFDLSADPGEKTDVMEKHPEVVALLRAEYEAWWESVQPQLVNEDAYRTAPAVNTFKTLYERQFGTDRP